MLEASIAVQKGVYCTFRRRGSKTTESTFFVNTPCMGLLFPSSSFSRCDIAQYCRVGGTEKESAMKMGEKHGEERTNTIATDERTRERETMNR